MDEIDDVQQAENDGKAEAEHGVESAVDQSEQYLAEECLRGYAQKIHCDTSSLLPSVLDAQHHFQSATIDLQLVVSQFRHNVPVFHHVVPVGDRRGEMKILFHQKDGEATALEHLNNFADLR